MSDKPGYTIQTVAAMVDQYVPDLASQLAFDADRIFGSPYARIDYLFANPALTAHLTSCIIDDAVDTCRASDHLPVIATFDL